MPIETDIPFSIDVQDLGHALRITRRWFYWTSIPMGLFALAWIGLLLCKYGDHLFNVGSFLFLGLGFLALYVSILSIINRTEIEIDHQELSIQHVPLPGPRKRKTIPIRDIDRLFVKIFRSSGNIAGSSRSWDLYMVDRFGKERQLISSLPDWNQAEFIKQELERFLNRVRGETDPHHGYFCHPRYPRGTL